MADKRSRGLPQGFDLNLPDSIPVVLGDYLDEEDSIRGDVMRAAARKTPPVEAQTSTQVGHSQGIKTEPDVQQMPEVEAPRVHAPIQALHVVPQVPQMPAPAMIESREVVAEKRPSLHPAWKRPRRKQLNLSSDAEHKLAEVLEYFKSYGPQEDIRMSEIFEALVILASESKERLQLSDLPRRGAWGSPTERNFPALIAEAFAKAISAQHQVWPKAENE